MFKKFKISFKHIIFISLIGTWLYSLTEPLYTPTALNVSRDHYNFPEVIAHKALTSDTFPANSWSAIEESLASTIGGIEVDVRISKDGVLFLYHGDTLDEYTNQQGIPESYDWLYLSQVKYKNTEEKLVSLDEFLATVGSQKTIFIDIKSNNKIDTEIAHRVVDAIKDHKLQENIFVESFNPITLAIIRLYSRDIMLMYDFVDNTKALSEETQSQFNKIPWLLKSHWVQKQIRRIIRPDVLGPRFNINHNVLQKLIANGYPIVTWTVDDPDIARNLYRSGIKGIQSNQPEAIENILTQNNKEILDAGGSTAVVHQIIKVNNIADIQQAIKKATEIGKSINIAGRRHSMGGHTFYNQGIVLNMLSFNHVIYNPDTKTITAQAGATWKKFKKFWRFMAEV
jgi:glycerophosphoryl diester phosphodiesterase